MSNISMEVGLGHSAEIAFSKLTELAKNTNSKINTTKLCNSVVLCNKSRKVRPEDMLEIIMEDDFNNIIPLRGRTNFTKLRFDHYESVGVRWVNQKDKVKLTKGTKLTETYSVVANDSTVSTDGLHSNLKSAKSAAMSLAFREKKSVIVNRHSTDGAKFKVGYYDLTVKKTNNTTSDKESDLTMFFPINKYAFFVNPDLSN